MTKESEFRKGVEELKKQYKEDFKLRQEFLKKFESLKRKAKISKYLQELEGMLNNLSDSFAEDMLQKLKEEAEIENQKTEMILEQFKQELNVSTKPEKKQPKKIIKSLGDLEETNEASVEEKQTAQINPENPQNTKTLGDNEL